MFCVYLNDRIISEAEAAIPVSDRGFLLGDGLFETMRAYGGRVFRLQAHLARLRASSEFLKIAVPACDGEIERRIAELIHRNGCPDAYVRITLTRGTGGKGGLRLDGEFASTLMISARPITPYPPEQYKHGARLIVSRYRQNSGSPLPQHKTLNYLLYLLARQEATDAGANGALLLNEHGQLTEEAVSNIFLVKEGRLLTPPVSCGLLPGIARATVIGLAARENIPLDDKPINCAIMFECDEMFLTNSMMEVMPVRSVDRRAFPVKAPGPVTERVAGLYRQAVQEELTSRPAASS